MTRNIVAILRGVHPDEAVDMAAVLGLWHHED